MGTRAKRAAQRGSAVTVTRYNGASMAFHWTMAVLIVVVGVLGLLHDSWPKQTQSFWINLHAILGLSVWVLIVARFWWRSRHSPPELPSEAGELSRRLSYPVHLLLYALIFVIPLVGIVTFIWHGRSTRRCAAAHVAGSSRSRSVRHTQSR
jgi:cytochrome b561